MLKRKKLIKLAKRIWKPAVVVMVLVMLPTSVFAKEIGETKIPKTKKEQVVAIGVNILGLKKCFDPNATPLQKALYCSRSCCLIAGLTSGCVSENTQPGTKIHAAATYCCASSWAAYAILLKCNREKTIIGPAPEL